MVEPIGFEPIHQWNRVTAGFDSPTSTGLQDTLFRMCIVKQAQLFPVGFLGPAICTEPASLCWFLLARYRHAFIPTARLFAHVLSAGWDHVSHHTCCITTPQKQNPGVFRSRVFN